MMQVKTHKPDCMWLHPSGACECETRVTTKAQKTDDKRHERKRAAKDAKLRPRESLVSQAELWERFAMAALQGGSIATFKVAEEVAYIADQLLAERNKRWSR